MTSEKSVWSKTAGKRIPKPPRVEAFLFAYEALCRQHGLCLAHEDSGGAFLVGPVNSGDVEWVMAARIEGINDDE